MKFETFEKFQNHFLTLCIELSHCQEEMTSELFELIANALSKELKDNLILYKLENNIKLLKKQSKFIGKLKKQGWRKKIIDEYQKVTKQNCENDKKEDKPIEILKPITVLPSEILLIDNLPIEIEKLP